MMDLRGIALDADEREYLQHPLIGGVILFARNYQSPHQLSALTQDIHDLRKPALLIAVDHEGGRVQRFRDELTLLPPPRAVGAYYDRDRRKAMVVAEQMGWLMAVELRAIGVDFSFAPVLDIDKGISRVIGDRAFHKRPEHVATLARAYVRGMRRAGMAAVGKHFPGHGSVTQDSHDDVPVDKRRYVDIEMDDMIPFARLIHARLPALMPAHVVYPAVDDKPAGFSSVWLQTILRQNLEFQGTLFSDDLSMAGAEVMGDYVDRARCAFAAGCDMILVCNNQKAVMTLLDQLAVHPNALLSARLMQMHGRHGYDFARLKDNEEWQAARDAMMHLVDAPELPLSDDEIHG